MPNQYNDHQPNAIERDRMERRKQLKRKSMISNGIVIGVIAVVIIGVIAGIVALVIGTSKKIKANRASQPTTVSATIASGAQQPRATVSPSTPLPTQGSQYGIYGTESTDDTDPYNTNDDSDSSSSDTDGNTGSVTGSGESLHYTASGRTSTGWDYNYSYDPSAVTVSCNYNTSISQYDFTITGVSEGYTAVTLYYNIDDDNEVPVVLNLYVDSNLNVTQVG